MKTLKTLSIASLTFFFFINCNWNSDKQKVHSIDDKTPIFEEELSDLPPDMTLNDAPSVLDIIEDEIMFDSYHKLLRVSYLVQDFESLENVTIFAPTNGAINSIDDSKLAKLTTPNKLEDLTYLLNYHIVDEEYDYNTLKSTIVLNENILRLKTLNDRFLALSVKSNHILITDESGNQAIISNPDLEAENGVVHGIDNILKPQKVD